MKKGILPLNKLFLVRLPRFKNALFKNKTKRRCFVQQIYFLLQNNRAGLSQQSHAIKTTYCFFKQCSWFNRK